MLRRKIDHGARFYDMRIRQMAKKPPATMSIKQVIDFWTSNRTIEEKLIESANHLRSELPHRLAHRLIDIQNLPFIVVCNPHMQKIYQIYLHSFDHIVDYPPINSMYDNSLFGEMLSELFDGHSNVVPELARALRDVQRCSSPAQQADMQQFLDRTLVRRISTRMIAGQHLASMNMHGATSPIKRDDASPEPQQQTIGLIEVYCCPAEVVRACAEAAAMQCEEHFGVAPKVDIQGHIEATFSYVRVHLDYMLLEILKNAMRATVEFQRKQLIENGGAEGLDDDAINDLLTLPDVQVVISGSEHEMCIKVSDRGGGIPHKLLSTVWTYGFTTADADKLLEESTQPQRGGRSLTPMHGFGFGLPLSRVYAKYFGGDLQVNSMMGYGTDVYLSLGRLGQNMEKLVGI